MISAREVQKGVSSPLINGKKHCSNCGHMSVCSVYRTIAPYLESQFTEETRPFVAGDLATICRAYFNASILAVLGGGE